MLILCIQVGNKQRPMRLKLTQLQYCSTLCQYVQVRQTSQLEGKWWQEKKNRVPDLRSFLDPVTPLLQAVKLAHLYKWHTSLQMLTYILPIIIMVCHVQLVLVTVCTCVCVYMCLCVDVSVCTCVCVMCGCLTWLVALMSAPWPTSQWTRATLLPRAAECRAVIPLCTAKKKRMSRSDVTRAIALLGVLGHSTRQISCYLVYATVHEA